MGTSRELRTVPPDTLLRTEEVVAPPRRPASGTRPPPVLLPWLRAQAINVTRHAAALRPFRREEFGTGDAAPSEGHIQAVNQLLGSLRRNLLRTTKQVTDAVTVTARQPTSLRLQDTLAHKERAHWLVEGVERIWDFYFELFGQRQGQYADWLLSCDRIALDCYRVAYTGLGTPRSVPAPPPFCYMRTGFSPATFRRGIPLRRLGKQLNPFPRVQLPYHRMVNPWTMGAMLHETSHNLQNELQLDRAVPSSIARRLREAGIPEPVTAVWVRWNREIFGDMVGCMLGGEAFVASLMDVIGRTQAQSLGYSPRSVHP